MYDHRSCRPSAGPRVAVLATLLTAFCAAQAAAQYVSPEGSVVRRVEGASDSLEITTNTSRILTLDKRIPRVQVNNPELLVVTPLSANQVQVSAKKAGVTQVNLWDEDNQIHTVDVYIYGDVRELENALRVQFPNSSVRVYRYSQSLVLTGFIDRPDFVDPIRQLAEDYAPKVINNIAVGGVQQVLLRVKIYEVSRTKLRQLGVDIAQVGTAGGYFGTSVSGLLSNVGSGGNPLGITTVARSAKGLTDTGGQTVEFAIVNGGDAFVGFLDALQQKNIAKILAEPNIVAVSGRPAQFNEGGEIPILIPQGLGQTAIEYKPYGTQVDFLPIVLGNGKIRLEVRPRISEIDDSRAVQINSTVIPALTVRQVDTAVEMRAGQTFAIAGLIQQRVATVNRGIPFLSDIPILGTPFRRTADTASEIELLVLVTPEFVDAMEPDEVPVCGPGMGTTSPTDSELYCGGKIEVPDRCNPCATGACQCPPCTAGGIPTAPPSFLNGPGSYTPVEEGSYGPPPAGSQGLSPELMGPQGMPTMAPQGPPMGPPAEVTPLGAGAPRPQAGLARQATPPSGRPVAAVAATPSDQFRSAGPAPYERQAPTPYEPAPPAAWAGGDGLIGPIGYDVP